MQAVNRTGVEFDMCPQCRGVWLDRGELDKIIERSGVSTAPDPAMADRGRYDRHDDRHRPHRKKSFFEELFD